MKDAIRSLLFTTALCGLLAAAPAIAAEVVSTSTASTTAVTHTRLTNHDVTAIQKLLTDKGFYKSAVDGQFGPGTQEAMQAFQTSEGLEANGYPTAATLAKLGVTPENPPATGDAEPAGKGGVVYTETVQVNEIAQKKRTGIDNVDSTSQNGGSCGTCTNGPVGNGATKSMRSNEY